MKNLINYIKNTLIKINNFILWTKKWHFFHILLNSSSLIMLISTIFALIASDTIGEIKFIYCLLAFFIYVPSIIVAVLIQIIFCTVNLVIHKKGSIKNKFLLENKKYNYVYYSMFIYTIISFIALFLITFSLITFSDEQCNYDDIACYEKFLNYYPQEYIAHFPSQIPKGTQNVEIYANTGGFHAGQSLIIKFDTNKNYIENELKKYSFKSKENPQHYAFRTLTDNDRIKINDFTFYVIDGTLDRFANNYGIGVNKSQNKIIYYYSNND